MSMKYWNMDEERIVTKTGIIEISLFDDGIRLPRFKIVRKNTKGIYGILGSMTSFEAIKVAEALIKIVKRNDLRSNGN